MKEKYKANPGSHRESPDAIVLLSGGLDSTTVLFFAKKEGYEPIALSFDYGQRHKVELKMAHEAAQTIGCRQIVLTVDPQIFKNSSLTDLNIPVPEKRNIDATIPSTYVPARNILFLAHALALGESMKIFNIFIGANALDYSGYPDCRPEFYEAFQKVAALGTKAGVEGRTIRIHTPLIQKSKSEIVKLGMELGVDFSRTSSCYNPDREGRPCLICDSCLLRKKGFQEAGTADPLDQV